MDDVIPMDMEADKHTHGWCCLLLAVACPHRSASINTSGNGAMAFSVLIALLIAVSIALLIALLIAVSIGLFGHP